MSRSSNLCSEKYLWLNGSCYLLHAARKELMEYLRGQIQEGVVAIGYAVSGGTTWLKGIQVPIDHARHMLQSPDDFLALVQRQTIIAAQRAIVDYLFDVLIELMDLRIDLHLSPQVQTAIRDRRKNVPQLKSIFRGMGVPIMCDDAVDREFSLLNVTRNIIEHNDGKATEDYIKFGGTGTVGAPITINAEVAGDAVSLIKVIVPDLDARLLERWKIPMS